ncbi:MAG TPA: ATP-binding cassette domain-containing protein [Arcobacter sp.]|nr:ATP-binding cassette domain-containing protein [Arcobacter sp.]
MTENEHKTPHLGNISVKGYKSIKSLDLNMSAINILIGANGAGKSNFISLFSFLNQLSQGKLRIYVEQQGFANTFFHFGAKHTPKISLKLDIGNNGYHVVFVHGANDDSLIFEEESCTFTSMSWQLQGKLGESGLLSESKAGFREYLENCRVYHFHDTSSSAGFKQANELNASDYLYKDAKNLASFLYRLRADYPKSYRDIVSTIQTVAPFFHDFYLEPRGRQGEEKILLKWLHRDHDETFSANQLSDGTARFICLTSLFLQPQELRPNTIVLDEPELGLHPASLEVLADMIKSTAKHNQVICSTQSISFANLFAPEEFIVVDQEKGISTFRRLDKSSLSHWLEDYGMGDIWNKNLIGGRPEW